MSIKDKILKYGSFALVLLAPIAYWSHGIYPHISSKTFFIYGAIELLFFVWLYTLITDSSYRIPKKILLYFLPATVFLVWLTIAGIFGANPTQSFWSSFARGTGLLTLYHTFLFGIIIASLVNRNGIKYVYSLMQYFVVGATLGAITIWFGPGGFGWLTPALKAGDGGGLVGNSSLAAVYMIFSLAFSTFLLLRKDFVENKKYWHILSIAVILFSPLFINICGLFNEYGIVGSARTSVIALPAMIAGIGILYLALSNKKNLRTLGVLGIALGVIAFSIFWWQLVTPQTKIHNAFAQEARGSRFIFWNIASEGLAKHPLLGYGPENYAIVFQDNFNPDSLLEKNSKEGWDDRAHNIYYETGISGGYPAILLYVVFLASILYAIYLAKQKNKISQLQAAILTGLIAGYVFQNLFIFDSNLSLLALFMLAGIIFGLQSDTEENTFNSTKIADPAKIALGALCAVLFFVCFIYFVYRPLDKSMLYIDAFTSPIDKRPDIYPKLFSGSQIGEQWDVSGLAYDTYRHYASGAQEIKADKQMLPYEIKNLEALLSYLYVVQSRNTTDYRLYVTISYLESTLTYFSDRPNDPMTTNKILDVLAKAKTLAPNNPNTYWGIAQTKIWGGDLAGAEAAYREAMNVAPKLPGSYTLFLKFAQVTGNKKLFDEIIQKAKQNIPDFVFN